MSKLKLLDLFSGIGGFSLGLERSGGFETVAFCEINPFCRKVLRKHWPDVPQYEDIRRLTAEQLIRDGIAVDAICGGFPCQDVSNAGRGAGLDGERSGLWFEYLRIIRELRPRIVIVENVAALLVRGLDRILGGLAEIGYDAEWECIRASDVGAPHVRNRIWVVAYPASEQDRRSEFFGLSPNIGASNSWPYASNANGDLSPLGKHVFQSGFETPRGEQERCSINRIFASEDATNSECRNRSLGWTPRRMGRFFECLSSDGDWPLTAEPVLGGGTNGFPDRLDQLRSLGNAVLPQIPEHIGRSIIRTMKSTP